MQSSPDTERLTVIIPCFNEADTVETTVQTIQEELPHLPLQATLLLVDDGSTDRTAEVLQRLAARYPNCQVRENGSNLGLGRTVTQCYASIPDDTWVSVIPGDNELIFRSISNLMAVRQDYDVVFGYLGNPVIRTLSRRFASAAFTAIMRILYGFPLRYLNGMKLYRIEAFRGIEVVSAGHGFNAELLAKAVLRNPDLRIGEAPFLARGRAHGQSKAFRPQSIARSVHEALTGYLSVCAYRRQIIAQEQHTATPADSARTR